MPHAVVNPSGTCERHGLIQVRLDFCLDKGDARYNDQRFRVDGAWLTERCFHHHFIYLDPYTLRDEQIEQAIALHLPNFYKAWVDERDKPQGGMRHGWDVATRKRPERFNKTQPELYATRKTECLSKLSILAASPFTTQVSKTGETFPATLIDVGDAVTDRSSYLDFVFFTVVSAVNPANASGAIDTVEIWLTSSNGVNVWAGTFSASGNVLTCRDSQNMGALVIGAKRTVSGLDIDIVTGDYIGACDKGPGSTSLLEADGSGGGGYWYGGGEYIDATDSRTFVLNSAGGMSLYGTGEGPTVYTVTPTIDMLLRAMDSEAVSLDMLLRATDSSDVSLDTLLRATDSKAVSLDVLLKTVESAGITLDSVLVDRLIEAINLDLLLRQSDSVTPTIDALLQDTDSVDVALDTILSQPTAEPPYYIEVRDASGNLLGVIKDILSGSLTQEDNLPETLSFAIPAGELRALLITRTNELYVRDAATDEVIAICTMVIDEAED